MHSNQEVRNNRRWGQTRLIISPRTAQNFKKQVPIMHLFPTLSHRLISRFVPTLAAKAAQQEVIQPADRKPDLCCAARALDKLPTAQLIPTAATTAAATTATTLYPTTINKRNKIYGGAIRAPLFIRDGAAVFSGIRNHWGGRGWRPSFRRKLPPSASICFCQSAGSSL